MTALVQESYFEGVIAEMNKKGFILFSRVTTEQTDDLRYHVPATVARDTRLFFHYPNTSLIVFLVYRESDLQWEGRESEGLESYWSIHFDYKYLPVRELVQAMFIREGESVPREERCMDHMDDWYRKVPLRDFTPYEEFYPNFRYCGNRTLEHRQNPETEGFDKLESEQLAENVWGFVHKAIPFLNKGPFDELQVTNFPPHYTFNGCEEKFWERFKTSSGQISTPHYLWSLVRRPWGSDGLKR